MVDIDGVTLHIDDTIEHVHPEIQGTGIVVGFGSAWNRVRICWSDKTTQVVDSSLIRLVVTNVPATPSYGGLVAE